MAGNTITGAFSNAGEGSFCVVEKRRIIANHQ